ncbi:MULTISPECIES: N-acetylmuramidase family protein [unclassified Caballeronia]|uniref:N-acetylmuramidase family protein n=1 Tax=unclassified Caballeronia TaxID=2646786 RepID=UPI0028666908|nr:MULTISPECIES: N-acetylmuramidase family protein [unclassified Caballeronia]MDR5776519.1 N-acetylmuramidase family protein [Caballeronia sp. LZ002]MDR5851954.1 N-acetylmuramidase family protein [Caballeronia sp. LZ003]
MRILRFGSMGDEVALLQHRLLRAGFELAVTHVFDEATETAVRKVQADAGLVVDGIAGPKTMLALATGKRDTKHLADADIVKAAASLDVPVECVRAVNEVESRGEGFLVDGRPVILFERHVFWERLVTHGIDPKPLAARYPNIVSETRGGYEGGSAEYVRLAWAQMLAPVAAWEATSWGAFQVMGEHWKRLDYQSPQEFVSRMEASEREQLDAFVRFVAADAKLLAALKSRRWEAFAEGYNGKAYKANLYDVKLARAYERYAPTPAPKPTPAEATA